jgi:hypothetical protein
MLAGMDYLSDDYVALEMNGGGPIGHSVFCSTHVEPAHLAGFPVLRPHAIPGRLAREDKSLILLSDLPQASLVPSVRIAALALPRVVDSIQTSFHRARRPQALLQLAQSSATLLPWPEALAEGFAAMSALVDRVPSYWLDLGRDLAQIPAAVQALLEEASL